MKKFLASLLVSAMALTLAACGGNPSSPSNGSNPSSGSGTTGGGDKTTINVIISQYGNYTEDTVTLEEAEADDDGVVSLASMAQDWDGSVLEGPALVLRETLPGGVYETRLYRYDGVIMEEYALADAPYDPEKATAIVVSSVFDFTYRDGLLTLTTDAGTVSVALRSGGGDA